MKEMTEAVTMKTVSTLSYATTAILAASTGMVLARKESPQQQRNDNFSSPSSSAPTNRFSVSPFSSRENSPYPGTEHGDREASTTGWISNSPQKRQSVHFSRNQTPVSSKSASTPESSSSRKPHKLKRRRSSKVSPPLFGWMSRSKSPTPVDQIPLTPSPAVTSSPVTHEEEHYHLYDIGTRETRPVLGNPRYSIASIHSITANTPRTPLRRIYPPPQKKDSPRLISPHNLCQTASCSASQHGTPPSREQLMIKTLRRMTSDEQMSPTRSSGHRRNQSVPSFDNVASPSRTPDHTRSNGYTYETPSRPTTVWLVDETPTTGDRSFGSQARRRLEFQHGRKTSASSSFAQRLVSQSPPSPIPERQASLNWDSEGSDPTYESMKMENDDTRRKSRLSSLFDDTDIEKASIPDHKSPRTIVKILSRESSQDDLDWSESLLMSNGCHPNIKPRLPKSKGVRDVMVPARSTSLSRSNSVPPLRPEPSPERLPKRLSAPKECWDNDFEDEGSDMWMIPENITDAQDKLKGYLSNIRTFSTLIEDLKQFRQSHPRIHRRSASQEQILDEIDAMIEISTLDGFTPPSYPGPPPSPKKSVESFSSSQWSFEEKFTNISMEERGGALPTPPPTGPITDMRDLAARKLLEKILGESEEARMEVKPEQITKLIDYVLRLRGRCDAGGFDKGGEDVVGLQNGACIGLGVYV